jgi:hypothetical protein
MMARCESELDKSAVVGDEIQIGQTATGEAIRPIDHGKSSSCYARAFSPARIFLKKKRKVFM